MGVEERTAARTPAPEQVIRVRQRPCVCDLTSRSCEPQAPLRQAEDPSSSRTGVWGGGRGGSLGPLRSSAGLWDQGGLVSGISSRSLIPWSLGETGSHGEGSHCGDLHSKPPQPPHSVSVLIRIPTSPPFSPGSD